MRRQRTKNRLTLGVFVHDLDESVAFKRYLGIVERAQQLDVNILCLVQGNRKEPEYKNICNAILSGNIDGIICGMASRYSMMTPDELKTLYLRFNIPLVCISDEWPELPGVSFDNAQGIREGLLHLIVEHGLEKIFFIRGPVNHSLAEVRYRAYCATMQEEGLYNPALISVAADWTPNRDYSFQQLTAGLRPKLDYEAILACNDQWALEAIHQLQLAGLGVPEDVAVVGFNNTKQASSSNPPLTTIRPPFVEQGQRAVDKLVSLIQGQAEAEPFTLLPTRLVIRESCGCLKMTVLGLKNAPVPAPDSGILLHQPWSETAIVAGIDLQLQQMGPTMDIKWIEELVASFRQALCGPDEVFLQAVNRLIRKTVQSGYGVSFWQQFLEIARSQLLPYIEAPLRPRTEDLWREAQIVVGHNAAWVKDHLMMGNQKMLWSANLFNTALFQRNDVQGIIQQMEWYFPQLGFDSCYFVMYEAGPYIYPRIFPEYAKLLFAYNQQGKIPIDVEGRRFLTREFLPEDILPVNQYHLIVEPLYYEELQFGYMVLGFDEQALFSYQMIFPHFQTCLKGIYQYQQQKITEESLIKQRIDLARSNSELQQFANITSHDLQEPLRKITTFSGRLKKTCEGVLPEPAQDYLERMENAARRMQDLITDLSVFCRVNNKPREVEKVYLDEVIREVLSDFDVVIAETKATIELAVLPAVLADTFQMRQLFQNLIGNGLKFHRPETPPLVRIYPGTKAFSGKTEIIVEDNGIGIEELYFERIFQVFERLHNHQEYQGSGVGLAICKKIVEDHGGKIKVSSQVGVGTRFSVFLPVAIG